VLGKRGDGDGAGEYCQVHSGLYLAGQRAPTIVEPSYKGRAQVRIISVLTPVVVLLMTATSLAQTVTLQVKNTCPSYRGRHNEPFSRYSLTATGGAAGGGGYRFDIGGTIWCGYPVVGGTGPHDPQFGASFQESHTVKGTKKAQYILDLSAFQNHCSGLALFQGVTFRVQVVQLGSDMATMLGQSSAIEDSQLCPNPGTCERTWCPCPHDGTCEEDSECSRCGTYLQCKGTQCICPYPECSELVQCIPPHECVDPCKKKPWLCDSSKKMRDAGKVPKKWPKQPSK
jgi:hypothetical protein